jgi:NADPH:quinone reductase
VLRVTGYNLEAGELEMGIMTKRAEEAKLQVPIAAVYTLGEAAKAHERLEEGHILGRIILRTKLGMSQPEIMPDGAD